MSARPETATCLIDSIDRNAPLLSPQKIINLEKGRYLQKVGDRSEAKAARTIEGLRVDGVKVASDVIRTEKCGYLDKKGIDLIVVLADGLEVGVQVKSSFRRIQQYLGKIQKMLDETGESSFISPRGYLEEQKIIVLNGMRSRECIAATFLYQVDRIRQRQEISRAA